MMKGKRENHEKGKQGGRIDGESRKEVAWWKEIGRIKRRDGIVEGERENKKSESIAEVENQEKKKHVGRKE
jgi:hypothetical protein